MDISGEADQEFRVWVPKKSCVNGVKVGGPISKSQGNSTSKQRKIIELRLALPGSVEPPRN